MADQRITIGIGTNYTGEGMSKALKSLQQLSGAVTRSAGIISAMAGTMGDLDTSAAKAMTAVAGFMQALATGNPVVITMTAAMVALSKVMADQKSKIDELKKASDELKASVDAAFSKALTDTLSSAQTQAAALVADFDRITKSANAFTAALRGVQSANDKGSIIQLQTDKLNAMIKAQADGGEALVAAEYDLLIAKEKAAQAQQSATADLEAATKAAADNETRTAKLEEAREKLMQEQIDLETVLINTDGEQRKKTQAAIDKLVAEQEKYSSQIAASVDQQSVLDANVAKAKSELANAEAQAALDVKTAQNNIDKLNRAEKEAKQKRLEAIEKEAKAAEEAAIADLNKQLADATKGLADAHKAVADAEKQYQAALEKYNSNINANLANDRLNDYYAKVAAAGGTGHVIKGWTGAGKGEDQRAAEVVAQQGIRDGSIRNTRQLADTRKAAARANRDYNSSKEAAQERKDAEDYARLSGMSEKSMNDWQKKRLADLQALKDAKDKDAADLKAAEEAKQQAQRAEAQMQMDVADIKNLLEQKLGLK